MAMQAAADRLMGLIAEDLMSREVLTLPRQMPIQDALQALARARVGGAPVVDEQGRCVGVFSVSDCSRQVRSGNEVAHMPPPIPGCVCCEWEVVEVAWEALPADAVSRYMTPDPVLVRPATAVGELAQMMVDVHIHRLIVVDENRQPIGIVSSTDVLAAVARAAWEREYKGDDHASSLQ